MIDDFKPAPGRRESLSAEPADKTPLPERQTDTPIPEQPFRTPEEVAAAGTPEPGAGDAETAGKPEEEQQAHPRKRRLPWGKPALKFPPGKKEIILAVVAVLLIGGGVAAWLLLHPSKPAPVAAVSKPKPAPAVVTPPKPTTVPSALTGLQVDPSVNARPVTGVMIENSIDARPQSGLSSAGVVFEAIAEGGITRFLALYQDTLPDNVGPIRSARPYYLQWALGFDAGYAHVGGSPEALRDIINWHVRDLDQFYNSRYYHRISSRAAPHNVYTGIPTLLQLETAKGYTGSSFTSWPRKAEAPAAQPTARTINFSISGSTYNVHYDYDATTNSYKRSEGGAAHIDANGNVRIAPKVVIALVMPYSLESDGYHSDYNTVGSGPAYVFQDGTVTIGQWAKSSISSQFVFTDANGQPLQLNPGQTWLTALGKTSYISYTP